jgi:hypothetical protein
MTRALSEATSTMARAATTLLDGGFLQIYDGETMLAQMRFSSPAFGPIEDGFALANELMVGTGRADGLATQWVALTETGTPVLAGIVGDDMLLSQRYIATGADVRITRFTYDQGQP